MINLDLNAKEKERKSILDGALVIMIKNSKEVKKLVGNELYYKVLRAHGYEHANQIKTVEKGCGVMGEMLRIKRESGNA